MDNWNGSRHNEHLGVNKNGKNIRKSPLHEPNNGASTTNAAARQPQVYKISKNDFRNVVQQLTGSPSHESSLPRPLSNSPKPPSMRLHKIRPPPLPSMNRPPLMYAPAPMAPPPAPLTPGNALWASAADSPISAYMRYLQNSMMDSGPRYPPPQVPQQFQPYQHQLQQPLPSSSSSSSSSGLLPNPSSGLLPSPRMNFPSPSSQFLLPSPNFFNLSPRSPYPLLSPGIQYVQPNFPFSSIGQSGILGPGPPLSPGIAFPLSPSGFFPMASPRWRGRQ